MMIKNGLSYLKFLNITNRNNRSSNKLYFGNLTINCRNKYLKSDNNQQFRNNLIYSPAQFTHSEYIKQLKNIKIAYYQLQSLNHLHESTKKHKIKNYQQLRKLINQLIVMCRFIAHARSYHQSFNPPLYSTLQYITNLIHRTFSEEANDSYQNIEQQHISDFKLIEFSVYLEVLNQLGIPFSQPILDKYLHSYMNILLQRSVIRYVFIYDLLRQYKNHEIIQQILYKSKKNIEIIFKAQQLMKKEGSILTTQQMVVYLGHLKPQIYNINEEERQKVIRIFLVYIQNISFKNITIIQSQNIISCLYLALQLSHQVGNYGQEIRYQILSWINKNIELRQNQSSVIQHLLTLNAHEDKQTCMKLDILLELWNYHFYLPSQFTSSSFQQLFFSIMSSIQHLSIKYWRFKYIIWFADSYFTNFHQYNYAILQNIFFSLRHKSLKTNDKIEPLIQFLKQLNFKKSNSFDQTVNIHEFASSWLSSQKEGLKHQNPSALCDLCQIADNHPSLQQIYSKYLIILLQISLGWFQWKELTKLYYYGLKFDIESFSEEALWNMEYVRRYILNQYVAMGINRRQIPQDSYFYKIISISTPQKFYKNYLKNSQ